MSNSIGQRVRDARKYSRFTQEELANRVGISQTAIHKLECGRSKSSRQTVAIALACGVNPVWLGTGQGDMVLNSPGAGASMDRNLNQAAEVSIQYQGDSGVKVPLLTWGHAGKNNSESDESDGGPSTIIEGWIPVYRRVSQNSYALRINSDVMEPEFTSGDLVIVDPDVVPKHNRYVVVRFPGDEEATFKQLVIDGGRKFLKPLNSRYPITEMLDEQQGQFCGVVVSKYRDV